MWGVRSSAGLIHSLPYAQPRQRPGRLPSKPNPTQHFGLGGVGTQTLDVGHGRRSCSLLLFGHGRGSGHGDGLPQLARYLGFG